MSTETSADGFVLWFRGRRKEPWRSIATAATEQDLFDAMDESGLRHGDWVTLPVGKDPNRGPRPRRGRRG